jgi:hypothetical protein
MNQVEVVVTNWRRPQNIVKILEAFRNQSVPCTLSVVDAGGEEYRLPAEAREMADNIYTMSQNYGAYNRYIPLANYHREFTYFHDDDMLPGTRAMEHFIASARQVPHGALFGQMGRRIVDEYKPSGVRRDVERCVSVDMVVRGYFVRTEHLYTIIRFRNLMGKQVREDDMLLAWGIRSFTDKGIYVTPDSGDPEERINKAELVTSHALSEDRDHLTMRTRFWQEAKALGEGLPRMRDGGEAHECRHARKVESFKKRAGLALEDINNVLISMRECGDFDELEPDVSLVEKCIDMALNAPGISSDDSFRLDYYPGDSISTVLDHRLFGGLPKPSAAIVVVGCMEGDVAGIPMQTCVIDASMTLMCLMQALEVAGIKSRLKPLSGQDAEDAVTVFGMEAGEFPLVMLLLGYSGGDGCHCGGCST